MPVMQNEDTKPQSCLKTEVTEEQIMLQVNLFQVTMKGWNGVATWKWVANDDTCGICRVAFDGCCPDCKLPGDDCPLVWGQGSSFRWRKAFKVEMQRNLRHAMMRNSAC